MKNDIFYFSGTGNCLKVASDLARELGETRIWPIPRALSQDVMLSGNSVGIIYPVYMFGMPRIVSRFIKKLGLFKDKYFFAIATCGGMAANSLGQTAFEMQKQGLRLSAGFIVKMPGNYTPLYGAIPIDQQKKMFEEERKRVKEIAQIVKQKEVKNIEKNSFFTNWLFSLIYKLGSPHIPKMDKKFWADNNCNSCGICEKVCPVNNIAMSAGRPQWLHHCEQCFACLQWCPQEAIQYAKTTKGRKRYRNPNIKLEELLKP